MKVTLSDLEQVARALSIKVTYDDLKTSKGGSCRVMETRRVLINKHLHANDKLALLARELGRFDLSGVEIADHVRKKIQRESDDQAPLKLSA
ncbi:MAG: hypothetical protein M0042_11500 [Nitrospiraceae bacterium]|nr:hypothetical protein [Nitrospiraceae bacterium]